MYLFFIIIIIDHWQDRIAIWLWTHFYNNPEKTRCLVKHRLCWSLSFQGLHAFSICTCTTGWQWRCFPCISTAEICLCCSYFTNSLHKIMQKSKIEDYQKQAYDNASTLNNSLPDNNFCLEGIFGQLFFSYRHCCIFPLVWPSDRMSSRMFLDRHSCW